MKEDPRNIIHTCPEHSSRPQSKFMTWDPNRFVGHHVKMEFQEIGTGKKEHLWIQVNCIKDADSLLGVIDNDPFLNLGVSCGDTIEVPINKIEMFFDGKDME